ncbi:MAG: hypothetical protein E6736_26115, partial [Leclercia adecarboxylata]|nr:hypothetical protein [Leclercia adecarboxylata]
YPLRRQCLNIVAFMFRITRDMGRNIGKNCAARQSETAVLSRFAVPVTADKANVTEIKAHSAKPS